ncbi:hypothetical protein [Natronoglycomyces albus]|uniref:Uncharacterized protein n=1 Tax=Natronoglycomyces albus TaxID=2811108 RepID=A0A895XSV6_9ACTN|nr:hypothetical protein [Natronoglycomyces albus]QSB04718.1 hypothetical protein JQS30_13205 [Natronoglycomyces albus]
MGVVAGLVAMVGVFFFIRWQDRSDLVGFYLEIPPESVCESDAVRGHVGEHALLGAQVEGTHGFPAATEGGEGITCEVKALAVDETELINVVIHLHQYEPNSFGPPCRSDSNDLHGRVDEWMHSSVSSIDIRSTRISIPEPYRSAGFEQWSLSTAAVNESIGFQGASLNLFIDGRTSPNPVDALLISCVANLYVQVGLRMDGEVPASLVGDGVVAFLADVRDEAYRAVLDHSIARY